MVWQIKELEKRFVNKNYILSEIVSILCVLYHFHVENMQQCPLNIDASMNWIRGYYDLVVRPHEDAINDVMLYQTFANVAAGQNIAAKGIIPRITFDQFLEEVKKPWVENPDDEVRGSTPAGYIPPITDKDWPVEVHEYMDMVEGMVNVDSDTNFSRYGGMKDKLGIERTEKDYDIHYDGSKKMQKTHPIDPINDPDITQINSNSYPKSPHFSTAEKYENKIVPTDPSMTVNKVIIGDVPTYNNPMNTTGTAPYQIDLKGKTTGDPIKEAISITSENVVKEKHTSSSKFGTYDPGEGTCCGESCGTCVDKE